MAEKSWSLGRALRGVFVKPTIDENTWDDLETALITADFGPDITEAIVEQLGQHLDHVCFPLSRLVGRGSRGVRRSGCVQLTGEW